MSDHDRALEAICAQAASLRSATIIDLTNLGGRVYRIRTNTGAVVVKVFGPDEARAARHEAVGYWAAHRAVEDWIPRRRELGALNTGHRYVIYDEIRGVPLQTAVDAGDIETSDALRLVGGILRRLHRVRGAAAFGQPGGPLVCSAAELLRKLVADRAPRLHSHGYADLASRLAQIADRLGDALMPTSEAALCHGDLHLRNVIVDSSSAGWQVSGIVDYESSIYAFPAFDLAKTLVVSGAFNADLCGALLEGHASTAIADDFLNDLMAFHVIDGWLWAALIEQRDQSVWRHRLRTVL